MIMMRNEWCFIFKYIYIYIAYIVTLDVSIALSENLIETRHQLVEMCCIICGLAILLVSNINNKH